MGRDVGLGLGLGQVKGLGLGLGLRLGLGLIEHCIVMYININIIAVYI